MSKLLMPVPVKAESVISNLYLNLGRRIESFPSKNCLLDTTKAFLELCHSQSCGKCVPCRMGLQQLKLLLEKILEGKGKESDIELIEETAQTVMRAADCAIGYEAAIVVLRGVRECRDVYESHIRTRHCTCSYETSAPCVGGCPAGVDIPGYIALLKEHRFSDAVRLIRMDNPFPATCGFICEHPCEGKCRRTVIDSPVNIRGLKKMACEYAKEVPPPECAVKTGKRVAVIGGGPCGLSAAYFLQLFGHDVEIFESLEKLGGMLRYGIPNYRLPKDKLDEDIEAILKTGVEFHTNVCVGRDIGFFELRHKFDAVLITIGASVDRKLGLDGENAEGVMSAVDFLRNVGKGDRMNLSGKAVCVVGGGNVSMDAVRTAVRLGAKRVSIVYRRGFADMTALPAEIEGAMAEGVEMIMLKAPAGIEVDSNNRVTGLKVDPQMISAISGGRSSVQKTGEQQYVIPCDLLIKAIGQNIDSGHFEFCGMPVNHGTIKTRLDGSIEGFSGVFAGGDCATGPATVVRAVQAAKICAANIDNYLGYNHSLTNDIDIPIPTQVDNTPCGRVNLAEREASIRKADFDAVEEYMTEKEFDQECARCLRCDHFGYGIFKGRGKEQW